MSFDSADNSWVLRTLPYQMLGRLPFTLCHMSTHIPVKTTNNYPITIQSNQVLTIHGLPRKTSFTTAVTESANTIHSSSLAVCPRVVSLEIPGSPYMRSKLVSSSLCMLDEVQVVDSW